MANVRLDALILRRDKVAADHQRLMGRLEAAQTDLVSVETEIRVIGIEPDQLDQVIERLGQRLDQALDTFDKDIATAEAALAPFTEGKAPK